MSLFVFVMQTIYAKEVADGLPQIADGEHEQHWLFVPDENEQLRVFNFTHIFAQFSFHLDAEAPDVLKRKVK